MDTLVSIIAFAALAVAFGFFAGIGLAAYGRAHDAVRRRVARRPDPARKPRRNVT